VRRAFASASAGLAAFAAVLALPASARDWAELDEGTCVTCHEVEPDEELAACVPEWRESVHAEVLVSCDACHGGDARLEDADESMSEEAGFLELPAWDEMAAHCGVCHEEIAETWLSGRFGTAMHTQRVATCADCHMRNGHRIREAVPEEIVTDEACPACPTMQEPDAALAMLREVERAEEALSAGVALVDGKGIDMTDFRVGAEQVHAAFARAVHEFDPESLGAAKALALTQYDGLSEQVAALEIEADTRRRLGVGLLSALALLFVALLGSLRSLR